MAASTQRWRLFWRRIGNLIHTKRTLKTEIILPKPSRYSPSQIFGFAGISVGVFGALYWFDRYRHQLALKEAEKEQTRQSRLLVTDLEKLSPRERRFVQFASIEYENDLYMTPKDFIESVLQERPRPRPPRHPISQKEIRAFVKHTPPVDKSSPHLFRSLGDNGLISYTEYLFLLCVLTKPQSGFRIAFNMFDTDGNERVDKEEFLVLSNVVSGVNDERQREEQEQRELDNGTLTDRIKAIFSEASGPQQKTEQPAGNIWKEPELVEQEPAGFYEFLKSIIFGKRLLVRKEYSGPDTTLLTLFFGPRGERVLRYEEFRKFMQNLQQETLQLEFNEYSEGATTINAVNFARILLRYTELDSEDRLAVLERVASSSESKQGLDFEQFYRFCSFLNNLDDFAVAMRMYTISNLPVSQAEFQRAVRISTGYHLDSTLVRVLFTMFDQDGDGHLSYDEFIMIMRDRIHRGYRSHLYKTTGWEGIKRCVGVRIAKS